jgi:ribosomal protein L40E
MAEAWLVRTSSSASLEESGGGTTSDNGYYAIYWTEIERGSLSAGSYEIEAYFTGDATFGSSSATETLVLWDYGAELWAALSSLLNVLFLCGLGILAIGCILFFGQRAFPKLARLGTGKLAFNLCPNCGARMPRNAKYCGKCGHKIE